MGPTSRDDNIQCLVTHLELSGDLDHLSESSSSDEEDFVPDFIVYDESSDPRFGGYEYEFVVFPNRANCRILEKMKHIS